MILGIHIANIGEVAPDTAKVEVTVENNIYEKLNSKPIPILIPIPPFTFREDNDIPIAVKINAAAAIAKRRSYSISKFFILATPLSF
jgi:hypothetical protein